jgi:type 1 glutamine amidotransferase
MGDHPIAWSRCIGSGRMFYSAIGHRPERYSDANYVQMLEQAVAWTSGPKTGRRADDCRPAR